jgi:hypothetical protein
MMRLTFEPYDYEPSPLVRTAHEIGDHPRPHGNRGECGYGARL